METNNLEKRIKRLEKQVLALFIALIVTSLSAIYCAIQIKSIATTVSQIPSYHEIKEDIKTLNKLYQVSEKKIPEAYDYTKDKATKAYDYSKEKSQELIQYFKEKTK